MAEQKFQAINWEGYHDRCNSWSGGAPDLLVISRLTCDSRIGANLYPSNAFDIAVTRDLGIALAAGREGRRRGVNILRLAGLALLLVRLMQPMVGTAEARAAAMV